MNTPYGKAQQAISILKEAVYELLLTAPVEGLRNAEIGRKLGIYHGHQGHEGHISRTLLALMQEDGVILQDEDIRKWKIRD